MMKRGTNLLGAAAGALLATAGILAGCNAVVGIDEPPPPGSVWETRGPRAKEDLDIRVRSAAERYEQGSSGCLTCHFGIENDHGKANLKIGCTDCHGGDGAATDKAKAHVA